MVDRWIPGRLRAEAGNQFVLSAATPAPFISVARFRPSSSFWSMTLVWREPSSEAALRRGRNPQAAPYALILPCGIWTATYASSGLFAATAGVVPGFTGSAYGDVGTCSYSDDRRRGVRRDDSVGGRGGLIGTAAAFWFLPK